MGSPKDDSSVETSPEANTAEEVLASAEPHQSSAAGDSDNEGTPEGENAITQPEESAEKTLPSDKGGGWRRALSGMSATKAALAFMLAGSFVQGFARCASNNITVPPTLAAGMVYAHNGGAQRNITLDETVSIGVVSVSVPSDFVAQNRHATSCYFRSADRQFGLYVSSIDYSDMEYSKIGANDLEAVTVELVDTVAGMFHLSVDNAGRPESGRRGDRKTLYASLTATLVDSSGQDTYRVELLSMRKGENGGALFAIYPSEVSREIKSACRKMLASATIL